MSDWFLETGLYLLGIALVPAIGVALIRWGLWGDRSKDRPRCPKCWYDMRGSLPKLECPECGHDAKEKRRLHKNCRRWRPIVLGVVLVLLSSYPLTIVGGWCREQSIMRKLTKRGHRAWKSTRTGPGWLVDRLPEHVALLFDRFSGVHLRNSPTDADLAECAKLWRLQSLTIDAGAGIVLTNEGLVHLQAMSQLRVLRLPGTRVPAADIARLKEALPNVVVPPHHSYLSPPHQTLPPNR